ncbi:hypothetical protein HGO38_27995 [Rhizobium sp. CG5]|uniref:hypothetical protein n=1 Tax=Rhizobium sp. CG5 TaxID=2726076 RepID=UPI0020345CE3|nr:hypothetical protein [Rhizobium sp. CG5]MCM2477299.1 hypothetical protein [Rhizobium sp. CG5]
MTGTRTSVKPERFKLTDNQFVHIERRDDDGWVIAFSDRNGTTLPTPGAFSVEASSSDHVVRTLKLAPGERPDTTNASGWVEFATHARIALETENGLLLRQFRLSGTSEVAADRGPLGGEAVDMGHGASVELLRQSTDHWSIVFYEDGVETATPEASLITVEIIDDKGDVQVFPTRDGENPTVLVTDISCIVPARVRIAWSHGDHAHRREFDLART